MKKMMRKMRENKGFTMAELLIVVAIIAVLVAISIPIFSAQLDKARNATDTANVRAAYAELVAEELGDISAQTLSKNIDFKGTAWNGDLPKEINTLSHPGAAGTKALKITFGANGAVTAASIN